MIIVFILPLTIYLLIRIALIAIYVFRINPAVHEEIYRNFHPQPTRDDYLENGSISMGKFMNKPFEHKQQDKWIKYKSYENWTKSTGTFIIAVISIINVLTHLSTLHNNFTYVMILILPSIVQIINEIFDQFAIDSPMLSKPSIPERYQYKKTKKS